MPEAPKDALVPVEPLERARLSLGEAWTLPSEAFTLPAVYEREKDRILTRSWLCAGRVEQVPEVGDTTTLDLLGDKLVIVRGEDRVVRVLSRICRHRAAEIVRGAGRQRSFRCPYHAWTYGLDGRLIGAPMMDGVSGFDRASCRLPALRSEIWEGWIFVNFDPDAEPLGPQLAPLSRRLAPYGMSELVAVETATFDSPFNWKVLVDNFMEAYHHIAIHRDTLQPMFPADLSHAPDNDGPWSLLVMPGKPEPEPGGEDPVSALPLVGPLDRAQARSLVAAVVYPFHLFAPGAHSCAWYQLLPTSFDHFTLRIFTCFPRETLADPRHLDAVQGLQAFTRAVHQQDIEACEAAWAGLAARSFSAGPLSAYEKPIWQFNQWWIGRMAGARS